MTNQTPIAEEITQEVFMFFIRNPHKFDATQGTLLSFLCGVARNKILNRLGGKWHCWIIFQPNHVQKNIFGNGLATEVVFQSGGIEEIFKD